MPRNKSRAKLRLKHFLKLFYHRALKRTYRLQKFNSYGMIFVHIPKAAGTAINVGLFGQLAGLGHASSQKYLQVYGASQFDAMYKFSFVRNPYDRFVSAYEYLRRGGNNSFDASFRDQKMADFKTFEDFVLNGFAKDKAIREHIHFRRQVDFLLIDNKIAVDFLGRFENIEDDYRYIASMIGHAKPLESSNASDRSKEYVAYFKNEAVRQAVADYYEADFERLNYSRDL